MKRLSSTTSQEGRLAQPQDIEYIVLPETEDTQGKDFWDYINILRRRKLLFIAPFLIFLPVITLYLTTQKSVYQATATVMIERVNPNVISIEEVLSPERTANSPDFYRTQYEIIKSPLIIGKVVDALRLYEEKPFRKSPPRSWIANEVTRTLRRTADNVTSVIQSFFNSIMVSEKNIENSAAVHARENTILPFERRRENAIAQLQNSLRVEPRKGTELVDITVSGSDNEAVVQIANKVAENYIQQNLDNKLDASRKAIAWLNKEAKFLRTKIDNTELSLEGFKKKEGFLPTEEFKSLQNRLVEKLNSLQNSYIEANNKRENVKIQINNLKSILNKDLDIIVMIMAKTPEIGDIFSIKALVLKYSEIRNDYYSISETFGEKHPKIVQLKSEIQRIKEAVYLEVEKFIQSMQEEYKMLTERENFLLKGMQEQTNRLIETSSNTTEFNKLKNELEIDKNLYLAVSKRLAETTLTEALETNNIKLVQPASFSNSPLTPQNGKKILLSAVITLALGAGLAFVRHSRDKRFRSIDEAERSLGVPFLGMIPSHREGRNGLIALYDPGVSASEAYRTLRTWIRLSSQSPVKTLLITSANLGEGKSHTAANLAISFAQLGQRVLLVDADLRRPMLHHVFNITNRRGLVNILAAGAELKSVLQNTIMENLKVLPTGGRPHNPAELLSTERMPSLLGSLKESFDILIVDAPVALSIPDVAILVPAMDAVLLVHCPLNGDRETVLEAKKTLDRAGANLLGIVFNNVKPKLQKYFYPQRHRQYSDDPIIPMRRQEGVTFVDMRPTENQERRMVIPPPSDDPCNHDA